MQAMEMTGRIEFPRENSETKVSTLAEGGATAVTVKTQLADFEQGAHEKWMRRGSRLLEGARCERAIGRGWGAVPVAEGAKVIEPGVGDCSA